MTCFYNNIRGMSIKCGSDKIVTSCSLVASRGRVQPEPIAKVRASRPEIFGCGCLGYIVHPFFHARELSFEKLLIAVSGINLPRAYYGGITPCGTALRVFEHSGYYVVEHTVFMLIRFHIGKPL